MRGGDFSVSSGNGLIGEASSEWSVSEGGDGEDCGEAARANGDTSSVGVRASGWRRSQVSAMENLAGLE